MVWTQSLSAKERKALGKKLANARKGKYKSFSEEHKRKLSISNKKAYQKKIASGWVHHNGYSRRNPQEIASNHIIRQYKSAAKKRFLDFNLTKEQVDDLISKDCSYCGAHPHERYVRLSHYMVKVIANGIDRVDSSKPYDVKNCVPCCRSCNLMKNKHSLTEFKLKIERIYKKICL